MMSLWSKKLRREKLKQQNNEQKNKSRLKLFFFIDSIVFELQLIALKIKELIILKWVNTWAF
jgi:hypothetical protein